MKRLALLPVLVCLPAWAPASGSTPDILVAAEADSFNKEWFISSDTASLLSGIDAAQGGGVSGLPVIHGLGDDRIRTLVDGVPVAAACPMHMNPPLSYIDPSSVTRIEILPGVTPVRLGGDSIAAPSRLKLPRPILARTMIPSNAAINCRLSIAATVPPTAPLQWPPWRAETSACPIKARQLMRSTTATDWGNASMLQASRHRTTRSPRRIAAARICSRRKRPCNTYRTRDFPTPTWICGETPPRSSTRAMWAATGGGDLHFSTFYDNIRHEMNGNAPDRYPPSVSITGFGEFPTRELGQDFGYRAEASIVVSARDTVRLGNELHMETLDDRWPGPPAGMVFDYISLNGATRAQLGTFAEWQRQWNDRLITEFGLRNDTVRMDTGPVQGYDGVDPEAAAFNAMHRVRTDVNIDSTLLIRYQPDEQESYTFGLARRIALPTSTSAMPGARTPWARSRGSATAIATPVVPT